MTAVQVLEILRERGVQLELRDGALRFRAPKGAMDAELRALVAAHRAALVAHLQREGEGTVAPAGLTTEDIASFKALGVSCRMSAPWCPEFWLVPERTGEPRLEMTVDEAATLLRLAEAIPGIEIECFCRLPLDADRRYWPREWRDHWEERAALMEYEGGLSRPEAERRAEARMRREHYGRSLLDGGEFDNAPRNSAYPEAASLSQDERWGVARTGRS